MVRRAQLLIAIALVSGVDVQARDVNKTFELLKKGKELSASDVRRLEEKIDKSPRDEEDRIELLSYYAAAPTGADLATVLAARARHILWIVENDPKNGLGLFEVSTGVYRVNCKGDDLADADGAKRVGDAWLAQVKNAPQVSEIRRLAVEALEFCSPEQAEQVLMASNDRAGLGGLYANAILGVTGLSYSSSVLYLHPDGDHPS